MEDDDLHETFTKLTVCTELFAPFVFAQAGLLLCNDARVVDAVHSRNRNHDQYQRLSRGTSGATTSGAGGGGGGQSVASSDVMCSMVVLSTAEREALVASLPLVHPTPTTTTTTTSSSSSSNSESVGVASSLQQDWLSAVKSLLGNENHHAAAILYRILVSDTVQR